MGFASSSEDIEKRRADTEFCKDEPAADLRAHLVAEVDPRKFERRSAPAPKLKKSKQQLAAERKYRERERARVLAQAIEPELRAEISRLEAENAELRNLLKMRIEALRVLLSRE